jgi:hypothetical protein
MSPAQNDIGAAQRSRSTAGRVRRAWRGLPGERRLAAMACIGLFLSLFLPWYQGTVIARGTTNLRQISWSMTAWGAFSFVEAAVLLVAAGVLTLLFMRAEGRAFHVPGGDGGVVTAAGVWTCVLIVWRIFDKQGTTGHGEYATTSGIEWGIFIALVIAGLLAYAGTRIRHAREPEPPLLGEQYEGPAAAAWADAAGSERSWAASDAEEAWTEPRVTRAPESERSRETQPRRRLRPRSVAGPEGSANPSRRSGSGSPDRQTARQLDLDLADPPTQALGEGRPPRGGSSAAG